LSLQLLTPRLGRAFEPSRVEAVDPWWRALVDDVAASPSRTAEQPGPSLGHVG